MLGIQNNNNFNIKINIIIDDTISVSTKRDLHGFEKMAILSL